MKWHFTLLELTQTWFLSSVQLALQFAAIQTEHFIVDYYVWLYGINNYNEISVYIYHLLVIRVYVSLGLIVYHCAYISSINCWHRLVDIEKYGLIIFFNNWNTEGKHSYTSHFPMMSLAFFRLCSIEWGTEVWHRSGG